MNIFMNNKNNSLSKKILLTTLLLSLATSQANAFSFSSLFSIFNTKRTTKKSGLSFTNKAILSIVGVSAIAFIAYFWPKKVNQPLDPVIIDYENPPAPRQTIKDDNRFKADNMLYGILLKLCRNNDIYAKNQLSSMLELKVNNEHNPNIYDIETLETLLEIACKNNNFGLARLFVENNAIIRQEDIDATNNKEIKDYLIAEKEKQDPAKSQENTSSKNEQSLETKKETTTKTENKSTKKTCVLMIDDKEAYTMELVNILQKKLGENTNLCVLDNKNNEQDTIRYQNFIKEKCSNNQCDLFLVACSKLGDRVNILRKELSREIHKKSTQAIILVARSSDKFKIEDKTKIGLGRAGKETESDFFEFNNIIPFEIQKMKLEKSTNNTNSLNLFERICKSRN